ncbi:kyphoscoliosis peptidase-like isoform X1 [Babylonia areolata]|uniref:kyphoscoliosis peptidase-like isoform X1 n=1 Tax=Babylonia areolata TaxID=304850 RepID=UPI003FD6AC1E
MGCGRSKPDGVAVMPQPLRSSASPTATDEKSKKPEVSSASVPQSSGAKGQKLPPFSPPKKTKDKLIPDPGIFSEVDEYVKQVSKTSANSVEELAKVLTTKYRDDMLKLRALFCWLALNVRYDTESFFSGRSMPQDAGSVLKSGMAVCQGYSQLLEALCREAGIPCVLVSGIAKGYSHDPENVYTAATKTNHSWNLVLVQGEWRPLECTWGAGFVDNGGHFVRSFQERWFLTDPEEFVLQHFPLVNSNLEESEKYQLLKKPMTIGQYSAHVKLESVAFAIGVKCLTHTQTVIDVIRDVTLKVKAERQPLAGMRATLRERGPGQGEESSTDVLTSLDDAGTCTIYVRPSRAATYLLKVMGRGRDQEPTQLHLLVTYVIRCQEPHANPEPFPDNALWGLQNPTASECGIRLTMTEKEGKKQQQQQQLHHPPNNATNKPNYLFTAKNGEAVATVCLSGDVTLKARLTHARAKDADLGEFTLIEYTEGGARITARLAERGYYLLRVFSSHPTREQLHPVVDFLMFSDSVGKFPCQPFPQVYSAAHQARAKLLSPLSGHVPAGESTLYRVVAPSLSKLTVAGQQMELKNDGVWEAEVTPPEGKSDVTIFGAVDKDAKSLSGLFKFTVKG